VITAGRFWVFTEAQPPGGRGPDQGAIQSQGNAYLDARFPQLDGVKHAEIVK